MLYLNKRRVIGIRGGLEIEPPIFSRRMEYLDKYYLLVLRFTSGGVKD